MGLVYRHATSAMTQMSAAVRREGFMACNVHSMIHTPSVRHTGGTCLACLRPALVTNVRRDATYRFTFSGAAAPAVVRERA